jgi:hypothetical protein
LPLGFRPRKKQLKGQLKYGEIDNKTHSTLVKNLRKQSNDLVFQVKRDLREFVEGKDLQLDSQNYAELYKVFGL